MQFKGCLAAAIAILFVLALPDPSAARTRHRTHVVHRRVAVIRSGYVTATYLPPLRATRRAPAPVLPHVVRAQPSAAPAIAAGDAHALWSNEPVATADAARRPRVLRGGDTGTRIPEDRFAVLFGPERPFRLSILPARAAGSARMFENNGYWFTVLDPVPRSWSGDWYDTDAMTIVEQNGGYFLVDASHPAEPLALRVTAAVD